MRRLGIRWWLLCEDHKTAKFARGLLQPIFSRPPEVRVAPRGGGSAEQWVVERYPIEVKKLHAIRATEKAALVVFVDGDSAGVEARLSALSRSEENRVAILVPTWSIETWLFWLCVRHPVNETTAYKRDPSYVRAERQDEVSPERAAAAWNPPHPDEAWRLPALARGRMDIDELKRRLGLS
jgi:hypothetical protein